MMHTSPLKSTKLFSSKCLRIDDGGVDVGEDLELARAAHVVAVAGGAVGDDLVAVALRAPARARTARSCACSRAMRRIQLSDLMLIDSSPVGLAGFSCLRPRSSETRCCDRARAAPAPRRCGAPSRSTAARAATSGAATTVGRPPSASSRMCASSGSSPSSRTPYSRAMRAPPPAPKMCSTCPQFEQTCTLMFSTMPSTGTDDLLEHLQPLAGIGERDVLRRGHDHGAGDRHALRERELDVAGAGRHVDHQVIERAPLRLARAAA